MPEAITYALWSWVPATLLLFWRLPPARAAAISLVVGWLLLPTARFADDVAGVDFPYWIMPVCLPSDQWMTKARVIGLGLLLGIVACDPKAWSRFRPAFWDLPMLGWCLAPLASGLANGAPIVGPFIDSAYQILAWGVPYLAGRLYFADPAGMRTLALAIVGGGVAYVPFCLIENVAGPTFYRLLYGFLPYEMIGASRYVGYRPVVLLEDGNQLGTWMASSTLVAGWLWRSRQLPTFWRVPGSFVLSLLATTTMLTQSVGAILLLAAGWATLELTRRVDRRWPIAIVLALPLAFVAARAANLFDAKALAMSTGVGRAAVGATVRLDRQSFGWRLRVEERAARYALQRPWLGWSRWDWWRGTPQGERPWGLFSLVAGMYGAAGLAALAGVFATPLAAFLAIGPPRFWINPARAPAAALAWTLVMNGLDAILNPALILVFAAAAGSLVGFLGYSKAASSWITRAQAGSAPLR